MSISHQEIECHLERARRERAAVIAQLLSGGASSMARALRRGTDRGVGLGRSAVAAIGAWHQQRATARELRGLDDRALKDIGVKRSDIDHLAAMIAASPERRFDRGAALPALDAAAALRTPLTSIRSYSEILRDNPHLPRATRERFLGIVIAESERLDRAIDRVLNSPSVQAPVRRAS
jgi:uncharacterized protein YjiS (DUF1127 family)